MGTAKPSKLFVKKTMNARMGLIRSFAIAFCWITIVPAACLASASAAQSPNFQKNTVCTLTLNSTEESNAFKRHFDSKLWNFVELTDGFSRDTNDWFRQSCEKEVNCDVLIISGHFGGTFFGESDLRLTMEDLEAASCSKKCSGILHRPKEVFLFGCNTLASKDKDTRTPEQYHQVLLQDGFSPAQASQIVAFRYSQLGDSFEQRMAEVFSGTQRIYGFSALAPSGVTAKPLVEKYLANSKRLYSNFSHNSSLLGSRPNQALLLAFRSTTIKQVTGFRSSSERPYCYLQDESTPRIEKLGFVRTSLKSGRALGTLPHIARYIREENTDTSPFTSDEESAIKKIGEDPQIKTELSGYLKLKGDVYLPIRISILNLMKDLRLISPSQYSQQIFSTLNLNLESAVSRTTVDRICSLDVSADLPVDRVPPARWEDDEFLSLLQCLKPKNVDILLKAFKIFSTSSVQFHRYSASVILGNSGTKNSTVLSLLSEALLYHPEEEVRTYAASQLAELKTQETNIQKSLARALLEDPSYSVRHAAAAALSDLLPTSPDIQMSLVRSLMNKDESYGVHEFVAHALRRSVVTDPSVLAYKKYWQ